MEKFAKLSFISLCGLPPPEVPLELDALPAPDRVFSLVRSAFAPFCDDSVEVETIDELRKMVPPSSNLHLIYAYGHAWLVNGGPRVLVGDGKQVPVTDGADLISSILDSSAPDRTVLMLDCCHAASFVALIQEPSPLPRFVVFASGAGENAIALHGESATRFRLALSRSLTSRAQIVDLAGVIIDVSHQLSRDGVLQGQDVSYQMRGSAVRIERGKTAPARRRERTVSLVRNGLIAAGALLATSMGLLGWFYKNHVLVDISTGGLSTIASSGLTVAVFREDPNSNRSDLVTMKAIEGDHIRLWVPAGDLILRIDAKYRDNAQRSLSYPFVLKPGFRESKTLSIVIPAAEEIERHPEMAFIAPTNWIHGRELEPTAQKTSFWIDLRPPTVEKYLPIARSLANAGQLKVENSFLLTALQRSAGLDAVGLGQVRSLNDNLGTIFGVLAQGESQQVSAPGDIVVGAGKMPCAGCPAPMTRFEAGLYCSSQRKRLPTDMEWELAARGVDGRVYPWGNQFDPTRANVPGLPEKGGVSPALKPVDAYPNGSSPYGLSDTVGNAGDWVSDESGSYERVYMGATYRYNPDDATVFRLLPVTDSDYLVQEITARCVSVQ